MKLEEITNTFTGVLTTREVDKNGNNSYKLFNLKDYENQTNNYELLPTNKDLTSKKIMEGDLIFRLIYPNKILYVDEKISGMIVPSQWCIIRPNQKFVRAKYLKWYLESEDGKEKIMPSIIGSTIQKISINALKKIDIPLIKLQRQKNIEDLIELWEEEKKIMNEAINKKEILYNAIIKETIQEEVEK